MSQYILYILAGLIGYLCKQAKCGNIDKIVIIERSDIAWEFLSFHNMLCRMEHAGRDLQTMCEVVGTSTRNITDCTALLTFHKPTEHFIQCPIPSAAHNQLIFAFHFFHFFSGVSGKLRDINRQIKFRFYKSVYNIQ